MEAEELLKKRFRELARKCYQNNIYTFTDFLSISDAACFYELEKELAYVPHTMWGGHRLCERVMIRFGNEEQLGYTEEFPIVCIRVSPLQAKFADELSHRDFLGALMNLGIERDTVGDIIAESSCGYFFCMERIAPFIMENLIRIRHTSVMCSRAQELPEFGDKDKQEIRIQIASPRIDGIFAKVFRLSRSGAAELFRQKKVFVNGRLCENSSIQLKSGDVISARGFGRFDYEGEQNISKKGKINALVQYYGKR